jgi:hypothetical protein
MGIAEIAMAQEERSELETLVEVLGTERAQHAAEDHELYVLVLDVQGRTEL